MKGMTVLQTLKPLVKKTAVRSGLLRLASRAGARKVAVLRYHSVLRRPEEFAGSIGAGIIHSDRNFAEQMELIAASYNPVSLDQVCAFTSGDADLPQRSVAITFDDGFADNLEVAGPILARCGIPAAIYLAVDYIGNQPPPWYVRLRYAFSVTRLPQWQGDRETAFDLTEPEQRREAFRDASRQCAKLCRKPQERLLAEIEVQLDIEPFSVPVMLTWEGARELIRQGHTIGSHTLSHPNVAYIDAAELTEELVASKAQIEKNTRTEVGHFSYPSPIMEPHYSDRAVAVTESAGYRSAVTCRPGPVVRGDSRLTLKRVFAQQTRAELEWTLENVFLGRSV